MSHQVPHEIQRDQRWTEREDACCCLGPNAGCQLYTRILYRNVKCAMAMHIGSQLAVSLLREDRSGPDGFALAISDFRLARGERILIVGPSASGKSTFLSLLAALPDIFFWGGLIHVAAGNPPAPLRCQQHLEA